MAARLRILCFVTLLLLAVPIKAQQANERLDSIINSLELKEVIVTAKKLNNQGIRYHIRPLHLEAKKTKHLKIFCVKCRALK